MTGPLIPMGIIGQGWDLVIALLIGMAFGYVLESAGFSSSRCFLWLRFYCLTCVLYSSNNCHGGFAVFRLYGMD